MFSIVNSGFKNWQKLMCNRHSVFWFVIIEVIAMAPKRCFKEKVITYSNLGHVKIASNQMSPPLSICCRMHDLNLHVQDQPIHTCLQSPVTSQCNCIENIPATSWVYIGLNWIFFKADVSLRDDHIRMIHGIHLLTSNILYSGIGEIKCSFLSQHFTWDWNSSRSVTWIFFSIV